MYEEFRAIVRYTAALEDIAEIKDLLNKLVSKTEENEPGTLGYEFFLNENTGELYLLGRWKDSRAFIEHEELCGKDPIVKRFSEKTTVTHIDSLGHMSDDLRKMFPDSHPIPHIVGFTR